MNWMRKKFKKVNKLTLAVLIILSLTPILWFVGKPGVLINGLDTNFPLDPFIWFSRRFFVWNSTINAGVDFSSSTSGVFFHFIQVLPYAFTSNLQAAEIFSLIFWFSAIVFSGYFFASSIFPKERFSSLVFTVLYTFNTYAFNTWENVKVSNLALLVGLPLFLGIVRRFSKGRISQIKFVIYLAVASLVTSGAGINPAYFIAIVLTVFIYSLIESLTADRKKRKLAVKAFLVTVLIMILVNLFWMLPLFKYLLLGRGVSSLEDIGLTNWLDSLSKDTSLVNVLRLQGAWDWYATDFVGAPLYIPYSVKYFYNPIFIIFSFSFFTLSLLSVFFSKVRQKNVIFFFLVLASLGVFLASGTHEPTGFIYVFLTQKVPFFSFFRSPWYIFTPLIILSFSGLISLFHKNIKTFVKPKIIVNILFAVYIIGNLFYCYPLVTGKIFRPGRPDSFFVKFPEYVFDAKAYLSKQNNDFRVVTYPDDQLESFSWGYKGTESILGLMSDIEVVSPSFNYANEGLKFLLESLYLNIKGQNYNAVSNQMGYLNANLLLDKLDNFSLSAKIDSNNPDLKSSFQREKIGSWDFYKSTAYPQGKIFSPTNIYRNLDDNLAFAQLSGYINPANLIVGSLDSVANKIPNVNDTPVFTRFVNKSVEDNPDSLVQKYEGKIPRQGKFDILIDSKSRSLTNAKIKIDNTFDLQYPALVNGFWVFSNVDFQDGDHLFDVSFLQNDNLVGINDFSQFSSESNLRKEELPANPTKTMLAFSDQKVAKKIKIPVDNFDPYVKYNIELDSKYFYGSVPVLELVQSAPTAPVKAEKYDLGISGDWDHTSVIFEPVPTQSKMEIIVSIPSNDKFPKSKSFLENITFKKIFDSNVYVVEHDQHLVEYPKVNISYEKVNPTLYKGHVRNASNGYLVVFSDSYDDGWELTTSSPNNQILHFTANSYANAWYVPPGDSDQEITLFYKPQRLRQIGLMVMIVGLAAVSYLAIKKRL